MATQEINPSAIKAEQPGRRSRSLNSHIREMLLECPSRQAFFARLLKIGMEQFPASVGRIDFSVGDATQTQSIHHPKMEKALAERFGKEYLKPLAEQVLQMAQSEPTMKRYERSGQTMTLVSAPVMNVAEEKADAVITLMLAGDHPGEVMLPRLDGISAMASALLISKTLSASGNSKDNGATAEATASAESAGLQDTNALASAAQFSSTKEFGYSIVNSLCTQLQAEQVVFGVERKQRIVVEAVSGVADFKDSSPGVSIVRQAMEECLDNDECVLVQQEKLEGMDHSRPLHEHWSIEGNNAAVMSIPLKEAGKTTGVVSIRRSPNKPFRQVDVDHLTKMLSPYGAAIRVVERANQSVGKQLKSAVGSTARQNLKKGSVGRKIVYAGLVLGLCWFLFGSMTYRPICRTRVTAADLRHFSAPFDAKLKNVFVRPGQEVAAGEVLVEFDTTDLRLQLNSLQRQITSTEVELRQAMSDDEVELAALARSRMVVLQTEAAAVLKQIRDAQVSAPSAGTVVIADLQQRVGQVFPQGEEILQVAAQGDWLLEIEIPDDIANYVSPEQTGTFAAASHPTEKLTFTLQHIDGAAITNDDRNVFMARAPLETRPRWMKSGMEGTARIETVSRPVWWVAMHRVVDWGRMNFWF